MQDQPTGLNPEDLKTLVEAVSTQTKVCNRAWFAMIALGLIILLPAVEHGVVGLPFGLQEVPADDFYTFALPFLTILMVSWKGCEVVLRPRAMVLLPEVTR